MTAFFLDRRQLLKLGSTALALPLVPSVAVARTEPALLFVAPSLTGPDFQPSALSHKIIWLKGDPMALWRQHYRPDIKIVGGITPWSDFVLLRGLAADHGLRVLRQEEQRRVEGAPVALHWIASS